MRIANEFVHISTGKVRIYLDNETQRKYQRIMGGISWPSKKPGAVVVLAETVAAFRQSPNYYVLTVYESQNLDGLINSALGFENYYKTQSWYGNLHNLECTHYLQVRNQLASDQRQATLLLQSAWYLKPTGLISHHLNIFKMLLAPNAKRLFLENKKLAASLGELPSAEVAEAKDTDYPLLAATGFAVTMMVSQPFQLRENRRFKKAKTEYDLWRDL
jgi:hypothetical protein